MQVETGLELADHKVVVFLGLYSLDGEPADPRVDLARKSLGLHVASFQIKRLSSVESEDLGGRKDVALVENSQAGVLIRDFWRLFPSELDRVVDNVVDRKVAHAEDWRQNGTAECAATSNGLVLVQSEREGLSEEVGHGLLDDGHTCAATNHFDVVNVLWLELGLGKGLLEGHRNAVQERLDHILHLLSLDHGADIDVVHQRFNAHGGLGVGRQNLLQLLCGSQGTSPGLGVSADVDLELLLELIGKVLGEGLVKVATTKVTIPGSGLDVQFSFAELDDRDSVVAGTDVDKGDSAGLLLGAGEIQFGDTVAQSDRRRVVDQSESLEAGNVGGIEHRPSLHICEPGGDTDDDIGHAQFDFVGSGVLDLVEVHGHQLGSAELLLLAEVRHLDTDLALDIAEGDGVVFLLGLDIGIGGAATDKTLQAADGVFEVGDLLGLGSFSQVSALGTESDQRSVVKKLESVSHEKRYNGSHRSHTYGVDLLETSFVICRQSQVSIQWLSTGIAHTMRYKNDMRRINSEGRRGRNVRYRYPYCGPHRLWCSAHRDQYRRHS